MRTSAGHVVVRPVATTLCIIVALACAVCNAAEPLHQQVDRLLEAGFKGEPAPRTSDAAFLRRIHLDLTGRIPSADDVREFLKNDASDKRLTVIDRLLDSPEYADRMANLFDVMLMERRGENSDWVKFLRACFADNKPWDQMATAILAPDREDEALRGAAYFYTRRIEKVGQQTTDFAGLTRDVGRMFLGVNLQCAECHDHLFIDDYTQRDFQGLFSIYKNVSIRKESFPAINEKVMTAKLEFVSVLTADKSATGPRIPFGKEFDIPEPPSADPDAKQKRPDPNDPPYFSALRLIADNLPSKDNALFRRNIANRIWFCMMGRGLVEPLDEFHADNQASHPELLKLLADEFAAHEFDIKWLIRELVLTDAWQRSSRMAEGAELPVSGSYQLGHQRRLTADQVFWSTLQATGNLKRLTPAEGAEPSEEFSALKAGFMTAFASEPEVAAVEYTPAVKQALFVLNDSNLLALTERQPGNLTDRLLSGPGDEIADELYLSVFSRMPNDGERQAINDYISANSDQREMAVRRLVWAMLTSIEFGINH